jgi:hypothetical protein
MIHSTERSLPLLPSSVRLSAAILTLRRLGMEVPRTRAQLWRDDPNAGSFPLTEFVWHYPSFLRLTYYFFYLNASESNQLRGYVLRQPPNRFAPLPGPPPALIAATPNFPPAIPDPSAPQNYAAQQHAANWDPPSPRRAGGDLAPGSSATPVPALAPAARLPPTNPGAASSAPAGTPKQYSGADKQKYMVEPWISEPYLVTCTNGRYAMGQLDG